MFWFKTFFSHNRVNANLSPYDSPDRPDRPSRLKQCNVQMIETITWKAARTIAKDQADD